MVVLDMQGMRPSGGGGSNISVTLCDKHSSKSITLCLRCGAGDAIGVEDGLTRPLPGRDPSATKKA